jgi:hypothetical protein
MGSDHNGMISGWLPGWRPRPLASLTFVALAVHSGPMPRTSRDKGNRRGQIDADGQAGRSRQGSWSASHRLNDSTEDAPQADRGADRARPRARLLVPGRRRCHDRRHWHRPRGGDRGPPSGQQPCGHRQRDTHPERLAGKLITDRHHAAQHGCARKSQRRAQQCKIWIRPHPVPPLTYRPDLTLPASSEGWPDHCLPPPPVVGVHDQPNHRVHVSTAAASGRSPSCALTLSAGHARERWARQRTSSRLYGPAGGPLVPASRITGRDERKVES